MSHKSWESFVESSSKSLLDTEMIFSSMDKGVMHYNGEYKGKKLYCSVSETCVSDYDYSAKETVGLVTQGYYVRLTLDGGEVLNTH